MQVHERQSDEQDVHDQFSDDSEGRGTFPRVPDFRRHSHCSQAPTGSDVIPGLGSRDRQEPEVELTDCSSCSSVDTARERHSVPTRRADSAHKLDTSVSRNDDDDDDDEIINVVDDLVT